MKVEKEGESARDGGNDDDDDDVVVSSEKGSRGRSEIRRENGSRWSRARTRGGRRRRRRRGGGGGAV